MIRPFECIDFRFSIYTFEIFDSFIGIFQSIIQLLVDSNFSAPSYPSARMISTRNIVFFQPLSYHHCLLLGQNDSSFHLDRNFLTGIIRKVITFILFSNFQMMHMHCIIPFVGVPVSKCRCSDF